MQETNFVLTVQLYIIRPQHSDLRHLFMKFTLWIKKNLPYKRGDHLIVEV